MAARSWEVGVNMGELYGMPHIRGKSGQDPEETENAAMSKSMETSISGARGRDRGLFWLLSKIVLWMERDSNKARMEPLARAGLGRRVLFIMLSQNHPSSVGVKRALDMGMDPNGTDEAGIPMAFRALVMNNRENTDWKGTQDILDAASTIDLEDPSGGTALAVAAQQGFHKLPLLEWLLARGANPHHEDKTGRTPLFRAMDGRRPYLSFGDPNEDVRVLNLLLGAAGETALSSRDRHGRTLLDLANDRKDAGAIECIEAWRRRWDSEKRREHLGAMAGRHHEGVDHLRRM